ncbi:hypothetical protein BGX28_003928 [Mortierella sp. GBA30]|nr:hypothetical protein BGX28_003928 [Mortierella sp. GBA30]
MALMAYSNFFSAMRGVMALVHTHVSFRQEVKLKDALQKRRSDIEEVMGVNIPHFSIDCDLHEGQKALKLMQKAAIGSIMHQAISNNPLYLDSVQVNKSQRMRKVDKMVQKIYEGKIDVIDRWLKDGTTAGNMKVSELDSNIEAANKFLREHDTGDLDLIFETHFTEGSSGCKSLSMRKDILLQVLELDCVIEDMQIEHSGVKVKEVQGGVGSKRWEVRLIRKVNQRGRYSARLYAKRCNKYRSEINELEAKLEGWKRTLEDVFWYQSVQREVSVETASTLHGAANAHQTPSVCHDDKISHDESEASDTDDSDSDVNSEDHAL